MTSPRSSSNQVQTLPAGTWAVDLPGGARMFCFGRQAGDFATHDGDDRLAAVTGGPWTRLVQVHGSRVAVVDRLGGSRGERADAAVSAQPGAALAVMTADCAPIGLSSPEGVGAVVHAGWRGLLAGVIEEAVNAMRALGAGSVSAALGPCIHPHAYPFSPDDLDQLAGRFGPTARSVDDQGRPALDLPATVRAALAGAGAQLVESSGTCTHCSAQHWSWRARADTGRQANVLVTGL